MAKLVKMTSSAGLQTGSNSFTVRSDDDIIIKPNSSVALLNGFISSGIVADYKIENTQTLGLVTGDKLGELYLVADPTTTPDRARDIVLTAGEYGITPMLNEMTDAFNRSLIYRSTTTTINPNVFETPVEPDFGLEVGCSLDTAKQITIKYNSAAQKTTPDLDYTNKTPGVNIAANGDITYTTPSGYASAALNSGASSDAFKSVVTTENIGTQFAVNDSVSLVSANGQEVFTGAVINNIQAVGTNADSALDLDKTLADIVNDIVYSDDQFLVLPPLPFGQGDNVTLDDGNGVPFTPSALTIKAKVAFPPSLYTATPNLAVTEVHDIQGINILELDIANAVEVTPDTKYKLTLELPFLDAGANHVIDDAIYYIKNATNNYVAVAKITNVSGILGQADKTVVEVDTLPFATPNIQLGDLKVFGSIEAYYSNEDQPTDNPHEPDDILGLFAPDDTLLCTFELDTFQAGTGTDDVDIIAKPASYVCLSADQATLLTDMQAMEQILILLGNDPAYLQQINMRCMNKFFSNNPVDVTADFQITDVCVFGDSATPISIELAGNPQTFVIGGNTYTKFILDIGAVPIDEYKLKRDLMVQLLQTPQMYKTSNLKRVKIELINLNPTGTSALTDMTRIWNGEDIQTTSDIDLRYATQGAAFTLANFALMVKGSVRPANSAYCVEDTRLNHACGRVCFFISDPQPCEFGLMPETINFNGQTPSNNDFKIAIENVPGLGFCYQMYRGQNKIPIKTPLRVAANDNVIIEWGVSTSVNGREYNNNVDSNTNPNVIDLNRDTFVIPASDIDPRDARKILVSIKRDAASNPPAFYLGCPISQPDTTDLNEVALCTTIPWTPREDPYIPPQYYNNDADLHVYVCPFLATLRILELSPTPMITFDGTAYKEFDGTHSLLHTTLHAINDPAQADEAHRLKTFANVFNFVFTNIDLQRRFGYKIATNILNGAAGSWSAEKSYLSAYLPENLTILLDTLSNVQSYDLEQNSGRRRSIIGTVVNSQDRLGEIVIEPNNLYHINLGNKEPINLRRFVVSLEDFYGNQIRLQSARAVINLLFNEPTA
jgi:hypothetical protein